jgi:hypothetical protein
MASTVLRIIRSSVPCRIAAARHLLGICTFISWIYLGLGFPIVVDGRVVAGRDVPSIATTKAARPTTEEALRQFAEVVDLARHDLSFALDQLERLNADRSSPFRGRLDVTRVGAVGHSLGGAAALQVTHEDPRIRGVVDIDGSPIWAANGELAKPLLVLSAASTPFDLTSAVPGTFALAPAAGMLDRLERDYESMTGMVFGSHPRL